MTNWDIKKKRLLEAKTSEEINFIFKDTLYYIDRTRALLRISPWLPNEHIGPNYKYMNPKEQYIYEKKKFLERTNNGTL